MWKNCEFSKHQDLFLSFPFLDIGVLNGSTDYIDYIRSPELNYPIMIGLDLYTRPFISIVFEIFVDDEIKICSQVFFQRYTGGSSWSWGSSYLADINNYLNNYENNFITSSRLNNDEFKFLINLLYNFYDKNNFIEFNNDKININGKLIDKNFKIRIINKL